MSRRNLRVAVRTTSARVHRGPSAREAFFSPSHASTSSASAESRTKIASVLGAFRALLLMLAHAIITCTNSQLLRWRRIRYRPRMDSDNLCAGCFEVPPTTPPEEREQILMDFARRGAVNPVLRALAVRLAEMAAVRLGRAPTLPELVQWLMGAVHLLVNYAPDPPGREVFQGVLWTLGGACGVDVSPLTGMRKGCGDCEDLSALLVALCTVLAAKKKKAVLVL